MSSPNPSGSWIESAVDAWRTFWFRPQSATTLGAVRIAFGLLMVVWTLSLLPELQTFFGSHGLVAHPPTGFTHWSLLSLGRGPMTVTLVWAGLLAASLALLVGWHSRLAALVVFVGISSFEWTNEFVFNAGDGLVRLESLFLLLAPSGAALSLDQRRTAGSFWAAQMRAPWAIRLIQLQLSLIYVFSVMDKLSGITWREGTAVSYALRMTDIATFVVPSWITANALAMNVATWGSLGLEVAIGFFVWNRRLRPWLLVAGIVMHAVIAVTFAIALFSLAIYVAYLSFVPPEAMDRLIARLRIRSALVGEAPGGGVVVEGGQAAPLP